MKLGKWTLLVSCLCVASAVNAQVGKKVVQAVVSDAAKEGTVVMAETVGKKVAPAVMSGVPEVVNMAGVMSDTRNVATGPIVSTPAPTLVAPSINNIPVYSPTVSNLSTSSLQSGFMVVYAVAHRFTAFPHTAHVTGFSSPSIVKL